MIKIACNCGGKSAGKTVYEVTTPKGRFTVSSLAEAKIKVAVDGGGTYREVKAG